MTGGRREWEEWKFGKFGWLGCSIDGEGMSGRVISGSSRGVVYVTCYDRERHTSHTNCNTSSSSQTFVDESVELRPAAEIN